MRMEGMRVAAATLYCMLIMLSDQHQQQVAGFAGFCGCFGNCYHGCREGHAHPGWFCTVKCVETCNTTVVSDEVHDATFGAADCSKICFTSICGVDQITVGTADSGATTAACIDDCTENWNPYKNNASSTLD